ncbi:Bifunctional arginine demethylase and lysyl-hydroxylase PSR [Trichostrongylus colubriformis]|uniref:Bifunctional arginine demethylase and lysyl-hydroxylase PSR n=1 Tax=Trichostrongylus colubriformis TaxID=6319 RepID=A0AAN8FPH1_TRICO
MQPSSSIFPEVNLWTYFTSTAFLRDFVEVILVVKKSIADAFNRVYYTRYERRISSAQKKDRPELSKSQWYSLNLAKTFKLPSLKDNMPRIDCNTLSVEEFCEKYEKPRLPCMITGLTKAWSAHENWKIDNLLQKYGNATFKCGECSDAKPVFLKFKYYAEYMSKNKDDSPMYIFDGKFGERHATREMLKDYEVPAYFRTNLFDILGSRKPQFRWIVIGPARSGTNIHIDPRGTAAWNALIHGHKRWVFIHPNAPRELVRIPKDQAGPHPKEAITWFSTVYKRICEGDWPFDKYPVIECRQHPGETLFVPCGWWHVVINEDDTVAITQNFCSSINLIYVYSTLAKRKPCLAQVFKERLIIEHPELLDKIKEASLNPTPIDDGYDTADESTTDGGDDNESDSTISLWSTDLSRIDSEYHEDVEMFEEENSEVDESDGKFESEGVINVKNEDDQSIGSFDFDEADSHMQMSGSDNGSEQWSGEEYDIEGGDEFDNSSGDGDAILKMPMRCKYDE